MEEFVESTAAKLNTFLTSVAAALERVAEIDSASFENGDEPTPEGLDLKQFISEAADNINSVCAELHEKVEENPAVTRLSKAPYLHSLAKENLREAIALQHLRDSQA